MRRYIPCLVVIALLAAAFTGCRPRALNAEQIQEILKDIRKAHRTLAVKGEVVTRVRVRGQMVSAGARIHRGSGRMQLEFVSGRANGAQIVQQQGSVRQISPDGETVRKLPHNPLDAMPRAGKNARVTVSPGSTIAGRPTDKITVKPATQSQARLQIWADKANSFPLRMDRYNAQGQLVSSTRYKEVSFSAEAPTIVKLPAEATPKQKQTAKVDKQKATELLGQDPVMPEYVPDGFDFQGYYHHQSRRGDIVALRYSDGVRLLTILQMQQPERVPEPGQVPGSAQARSSSGAEARQGMRGGRGAHTATDESPQRRGRRDKSGAATRRVAATSRGENLAGRQQDDTGGQQPGAGMQRGEEPKRSAAGMGAGDHQQVWRHRLRGRMIRFRRDGLLIVVVGDLPTVELRKVAAGMRESAINF